MPGVSWKIEEDRDAFRHEEITRKNTCPVSRASYDTRGAVFG
jgi:hypothetical protein